MAAPTPYDAQPQFALIPGLPVVSQFRYPLWQAKPIQPPEGVNLAGSSSEFVSVAPGNVYIPLGNLKPGLYLVEALIGKASAGLSASFSTPKPSPISVRRRWRRSRPWMRTWSDSPSTCRSRANGPLRELLTATGLTNRLGAKHVYPSVRAAVVAYHTQFGTR
jgi:hypothetical protein